MPKTRDVRTQKKDELHQHLVHQQNEQQGQDIRSITQYESGHGHRKCDVQRGEQPLDRQQVGEIFGQQLWVLTDVSVVETLNPEVVQDLKKVSEVEQREIGTVVFPNAILHPKVNPKYKNRLYQEIDKDEQ